MCARWKRWWGSRMSSILLVESCVGEKKVCASLSIEDVFRRVVKDAWRRSRGSMWPVER